MHAHGDHHRALARFLEETVTAQSNKERVLFVCTHNSARSQIAEGLLRQFGGERFEAYSAGTEATNVRPLAINAMQEIGIDIEGQSSKPLERYINWPFDKVNTVCHPPNQATPADFF